MTVPNGLRYKLIATFIRLSYEVPSYTVQRTTTPCSMHAFVQPRWFYSLLLC
jgi:hypothetical protein